MALIAQLLNALADRRDLLLENGAPRQQLAVYQRNANRPRSPQQEAKADRINTRSGMVPKEVITARQRACGAQNSF